MRLGSLWLPFEESQGKSFREIFTLSSHKCWTSLKTKPKQNKIPQNNQGIL